jgi:hypothetical protein
MVASSGWHPMSLRDAHRSLPFAQVRQPLMTIPNVLTFFRLLLVPVLLAMWDVKLVYAPFICAVIFIAASITDYFDGYLARRVRGGGSGLGIVRHARHKVHGHTCAPTCAQFVVCRMRRGLFPATCPRHNSARTRRVFVSNP